MSACTPKFRTKAQSLPDHKLQDLISPAWPGEAEALAAHPTPPPPWERYRLARDYLAEPKKARHHQPRTLRLDPAKQYVVIPETWGRPTGTVDLIEFQLHRVAVTEMVFNVPVDILESMG